MKTKGIPFWEQHLERLVLGLAVIVCVGLIALQFIGNPNSVQVSGKGDVGPGQIDELLADEAEQISSLMAPGARPTTPLPDPEEILPRFDQLKSAGVSPKPILAVGLPRLSPDTGISIGNPDAPFVVVAVPAPTDITADQYFDTIVNEEVEANAELKAVLQNPPYDVTWTTVGARFNVAEILSQYRNAGSNGEAALPPAWYNDRVDILNVRLERREYVDGQWANVKLVDLLPGQLSLRGEMVPPVGKTAGDAILAYAADPAVRVQIIQPEFFETANAVWHPPAKDDAALGADAPAIGAGPAAQVDPVQLQIAELKSSLKKLEDELERQKTKLAGLNCPPEEAPPPPKNPQRGGGAAPPGGTGGPSLGGGRGLSTPDGSNKNNEVECKKTRNLIKRLENRIKPIEAELERLLPNLDAEPAEEKPAEAPVVEQADVLDIWAHDMTVQPGKTYSYRLQVEIYNPLFAKKLDLMVNQQALAESFTSASQYSEWTPPMVIEPPLRVFITDATPANRVGGLGSTAVGQATAEVFRYRDTRWWSDRFVVKPGDRIGSARSGKAGDNASTGVDFRTDWFVLDVIEDVDAEGTSQQRFVTVLLQSLTSDEIVEKRVPREEVASSAYKQLREEVQVANLAGKVASQ